MSKRKQVFQAKVLQRLYPAALKVEKALDTPAHRPQAAQHSYGVQLKPSRVTGRKVYTVLPPPKEYVPARGDGSGSDSRPVSDADEIPADVSGSEDPKDAGGGGASKKRKRRRQRTAVKLSEGNPPTAAADDEKPDGAEAGNKGDAAGSERLSKNKRRKMKKRRHKEKLHALGLVPRSTALEFTYKQSEEEEEEGDGDEKTKVEEVLDFLQSTRDLCLSERSRGTSDRSVFHSVTESLFTRLSDGTSPPAALSALCRLRELLCQREVEKLRAALQDFTHTCTLPKDETEVICVLFQYWITEVLPMQMEKLT